MSKNAALLVLLVVIGIIPAINTEEPRQRALKHNTGLNNIIDQIQNDLIKHVKTGWNYDSKPATNGNIGNNGNGEPTGNRNLGGALTHNTWPNYNLDQIQNELIKYVKTQHGNLGKNGNSKPTGNENIGKNDNSEPTANENIEKISNGERGEPTGNVNLGFNNNSERQRALIPNTLKNNIIDQIQNELIKYAKTQQGSLGKNGNNKPTGNENIGNIVHSELTGNENIGKNGNGGPTGNENIGKNGNNKPTGNENIGNNVHSELTGNENIGYNDNSEPIEYKNIPDNVITGSAEDDDEIPYSLAEPPSLFCPVGLEKHIQTGECVKPEEVYTDVDYDYYK